jgi:hypothetical protein
MVGLLIAILIDISLVKIYDLTAKTLIPTQTKLLIFSFNSLCCLVLQFLAIQYLQGLTPTNRRSRRLGAKLPYQISLTALSLSGILIGLSIYQQFYHNYYDVLLSMLTLNINYGVACLFLIWLSVSFFNWYKSNRNLIVLSYFFSMLVISFSLFIVAVLSTAKMSYLPDQIVELLGGSSSVYIQRLLPLEEVNRISSVLSFLSIWVTSVLLMSYYRVKLVHTIVYWAILAIPLVYFAITYFFSYIIREVLVPYMHLSPLAISLLLGVFLTLSKPIGGLIFGLTFWNISRTIGYERSIRTYMIVSGWGIFLIFATNQALTQTVVPYPPFGLATITVLNLAGYFMLVGIHNSAALVSANTSLRRLIHKNALESRLLGLIGQAEFEMEVQEVVSKISRDKDLLDKNTDVSLDLDESELKRYLDFVIKEVKRDEGK